MTTNPDGVKPSPRRLDMDRLDRLARRFEQLFSFLIPIAAVLSALFVMGILISWLGVNVLDAYGALIKGAFGSKVDLANTLNRAAPLILAGLGVAFAFRGSVFNIGSEGQIMMGGVFATAAGIFVSGLPPLIHIPLCLLAGFIGGAFWGAIPGYFYAKNGVNIIITTIMMNEIASGVLASLVKGPMLEPPGYYNQTAMIAEAARLPLIWGGTRLHAGFLFAVVMAVICYIVLFRTSFGYETRTVGANQVAARHAGMNVFKIQLMIMIISGGLGGLAGAVEIMGAQYRLREAFLMNYGYEALAVAMLAQENPLLIIFSGLLFGALKVGASSMQVTTKLPQSLIQVVSGVIILFVIISGILRHLPRVIAKREVSRCGK